MTQTKHSQKGTIHRLFSNVWRWVVIGLIVILGVLGATVAFFGAALLLSAPYALLFIAFSVGFLITFGAVRKIARKMKFSRPRKMALIVAMVTILLLALECSLTIFGPWPSSQIARESPPIPSSVQHWNLSTGSHIAYLEVHAQGVANATPIIFVGGGPGEEDVADNSEVQFFGQLSQLGYNVYFYDQIGSGLSARLSNPAQYTLARHVADLEAIREEIGANQVILMGSSWGGTLVSNYMASYPQHVAKAIFTSPAPIDWYEWPNSGSIITRLSPSAQMQADQMLYYSPTFISWYLLGEINPEAAHNLVPDHEADSFFNSFLQLVLPGSVCNSSNLPDQIQQGNGFYDNIFTTRNALSIHPSVNPRTLLTSEQTPVLIMTGSCNYIPWQVEWQYRSTFPNSTLLYFPDAGHVIYLDQPSTYLASIRAFLLGTPLPLQPWTSSQPPPGAEA